MWILKVFKTSEAMKKFLAKHKNIQHGEVFINNEYAIEYRTLRKIL